jgi:hypothetical protein
MAAGVAGGTVASRFGATERRDAWWAGPAATALGLGLFIVYATFRAAYNADYRVDQVAHPESAYILSPFYSPLIAAPSWLPAWVSPAFLILWAPGGFRVTCYYYRKAYYRAYFLDPPACAVGEARGHGYRGETRMLLFQNLHRYFLYLALLFLVLLAIDVVEACIWPAPRGGHTFGVSVATLVLAANVTLLGLYTFSCHSLRHLVGGNVDCFSCVAFGHARQRAWSCVSRLNAHHMLFAWLSLFTVGFADFYVWMIASGTIDDLRLF